MPHVGWKQHKTAGLGPNPVFGGQGRNGRQVGGAELEPAILARTLAHGAGQLDVKRGGQPALAVDVVDVAPLARGQAHGPGAADGEGARAARPQGIGHGVAAEAEVRHIGGDGRLQRKQQRLDHRVADIGQLDRGLGAAAHRLVERGADSVMQGVQPPGQVAQKAMQAGPAPGRLQGVGPHHAAVVVERPVGRVLAEQTHGGRGQGDQLGIERGLAAQGIEDDRRPLRLAGAQARLGQEDGDLRVARRQALGGLGMGQGVRGLMVQSRSSGGGGVELRAGRAPRQGVLQYRIGLGRAEGLCQQASLEHGEAGRPGPGQALVDHGQGAVHTQGPGE